MADSTGFGTKIEYSMDGGSSWNTVGGVHDTITGPEMEADAVEVTDHDSTDGWREYIGGLKNAGELGFKVNWDPAVTQHDDFVAQLGKTLLWKITFPDGSSTVTFSGVLTGYVPDVPLDDRMTAEITIQASGKPTWV